jgi:TIR domain-containing protein
MAHVFFSYSRSDRDLAQQLRRDLSAGGLDIWSDRELGLGGRWLTEISLAISASRAVVVLASPKALASKWVMREVDTAQTLGIPVVPVLAVGTRYGDLPTNLVGVNGVDLADGYEESVNMIVAGLRGIERQRVGAESAAKKAPTLVLLTVDNQLDQQVREISQSVGLVVNRLSGEQDNLADLLRNVHIAVIDDDTSRVALFVAGYVAGRGGRVICLTAGHDKFMPSVPGIMFHPRVLEELEREICTAAFLPVRPL